MCDKYKTNKTRKICLGATYMTTIPITFLTYSAVKFVYNNANTVKDGIISALNVSKQHKEAINKNKYQHINDTMQAYKDVIKTDSEICSQTIDKDKTENNSWCNKTRDNINSFLNTMRDALHNNKDE